MKIQKHTLFVILSVSLTVGMPGQVLMAADASAELRKLFTQLPDARATCGALVVDLQTGETIASHNATEPMAPASNQKILVMAAAVERLGPNEGFRTVLARRGDDLILIGGGDPGLGDERLAADHGVERTAFLDLWAHALSAGGDSSIPGNLLVDATIFDEEWTHPEWEPGDLVKWYGAPIGGLNLNDNCVDITVWPGQAPGSPANWSLMPACSAAQVINRCQTVAGRKQGRPAVGRQPGTFELVLTGTVGERGVLQPVSVVEPNRFSALAIREYLAAKGVTIAGELRFERVRTSGGELPADCRVISERVTPLPDVLKRVGVHSQNMFAESLLKRLGYEWAKGRPNVAAVGSWANGRQAIGEFLAKIGCDTSRMVVSDGSGLSRANRVSAADFVQVLTYMHSHPNRELFVQSLAGNQTGGTLEKRMSEVKAAVYAKTGYMSGIRTLSGYVKTEDNRWYAFSVLFNGFSGSSAPYNAIHVDVCQILARTSSGRPS